MENNILVQGANRLNELYSERTEAGHYDASLVGVAAMLRNLAEYDLFRESEGKAVDTEHDLDIATRDIMLFQQIIWIIKDWDNFYPSVMEELIVTVCKNAIAEAEDNL